MSYFAGIVSSRSLGTGLAGPEIDSHRDMLYSKSAQYAVRAITFLAERTSTNYWRLETIAQAEQIPRHFLAKLMQRLSKKRIVHSVKGLKGGFALAKPAESISLYAIADAIDDLAVSTSECVFRETECSDREICPLHDSWKKLQEEQLQFLQTTSIADVARTRRDGTEGHGSR
jgi:Rrf2 family protein